LFHEILVEVFGGKNTEVQGSTNEQSVNKLTLRDDAAR
jgi:hypothetical protein